MTRTSPRLRAFTLVEMLVVIAIIAVLMGLAFPVFQSVQNSAKRTQAKNDITQLVTAVNAFYTEYGRYPLPATATDPYVCGGSGTSCKPVLDALRGVDATLNPRQIPFINVADAKDQTNPRNGIKTTDSQWYDPWGTPYALSIDADYNNEVVNPYSAGAGSSPLRNPVIAWSQGKDLRTAGDKSAGFAKDDVISWQ